MFKIEKSSFRRSTLSVAVMGLLSSGAMAQDTQQKDDDDFEQIIVTATKRAESIEDIPFSINAQTQRDFERSGAGNLEDVVGFVNQIVWSFRISRKSICPLIYRLRLVLNRLEGETQFRLPVDVFFI